MIRSVLSYMGAWSRVNNSYRSEFESLCRALENYALGRVVLAEDSSQHPRRLWEKALYDEGWSVNEQTHFTSSGRRLPVRFVGPQKNGLAAQIAFNNPDFLSRWLFTYATLSVRNGVAEVPILVVPMMDSLSDSERNRTIHLVNNFEYYRDQLEMLSPLSLGVPFLILGYSVQSELFEIDILELDQEARVNNSEENVIINKSIEFPPEYHQAGIGILNFFSTYLRENYPSQNATVRIEQSGLKVRMVVVSEDGRSDIIEKAMHEYEQIISGQEKATKFTQNEKLILDLRNEVRVAKFRIEAQQDIIALQNERIKSSEERVDTLLLLVGQGLQKDSGRVSVQVNPCIQNNISIEVNTDISASLGCLDELSDLLPKQDEIMLPIIDLAKSLQSIEREKESSVVRSSSAMTKFSRFIDKLSDANSSIRKAIDVTQQGFEIAQDLVSKYNRIASWCGLPVVPTFK